MKLFFQKDCRGITLIELMVTLVIGAILMVGLFTAFISQHRSYTVQDQISTIQQSVRAGMNLMVREIRMAGFNPNLCPGQGCPIGSYRFGILPPASKDSITISFDHDESGNLDPGETITYCLGKCDANGCLCKCDANESCNLLRNDGKGLQLVIENVVNKANDTALGLPKPLFTYDILADGRMDDIGSGLASVMDGLDNDGDGNIDRDDTDGEMISTSTPDDYYTTNNLGDVNGDGVANDADKQFFRDAIRDVIITLVVRTEMEDANYPGGLNIRGTAADGTCRTRTLSARVRLRNLGLGLAPGSAVVTISSGT